MTVLPYNNPERSKKTQVEEMFDNISQRYDLLNHLLSVNIDRIWRKRAIKELQGIRPATILDIATGTGDFALAAMHLENCTVTGIDLSEGMITAGRKKVIKRGFEHRIKFIKADSENLPFNDDSFDAAIAGFGVRNFENTEQGISEIFRVLKPEGLFVVLEFSKPKSPLIRKLYYGYFHKVLPAVGRIISKDHRAYTYLPESVGAFPDGLDFMQLLENAGFEGKGIYPQTMGIATIYVAKKP